MDLLFGEFESVNDVGLHFEVHSYKSSKFFFNNEMYAWMKILLRWNIRILAFQSRQQWTDDIAVVSPDISSYYFIAEALLVLQFSHSAAQKMIKTQSTNSK